MRLASSALRHRGGRRHPGNRSLDSEAASVDPDAAVGDVKIAIIMRHDDKGLAPPLEIGKQLLVEDAAKGWILLGCPFIEHRNRTSLQIDLDQREALALARG